MKPTTGQITSKVYRCKRCGHEQQIETNHFGECYSVRHYNVCPACPPWAKYPEFGSVTTWVCAEPCPPDMDKPENWQVVKVKRRPHEVRGSAASNACFGA